MPRACVIVLDAVGAGALPDASDYGDEGSDTLGNVAKAVGGLDLPNLEALGLGNVEPLEGCPPQPGAPAVAGRLVERSRGKDTTTGHWEMMGVVTPQPMPTYPHGFPHDVIDPFMHRTGRGVLGNKTASGTEIIQELGEEHQLTGKWIVYTSADSVFQIAAHEDTIPLEELYRASGIAREILTGKHAVGRVIARPFTGEPGNYERTANRQDFDRRLPDLLDALRPQDLLILTSDHGCDPTTPSTDHSREHAMLLAYVEGKNAAGQIHEGEFADVGATVNAWLGGKSPSRGIPGQPIVER